MRGEGGWGALLDFATPEKRVFQESKTIPDTERAIEQTENQISFLLGNNPGSIPRGQSLTQQQELPAVPAGLPLFMPLRHPGNRRPQGRLEGPGRTARPGAGVGLSPAH